MVIWFSLKASFDSKVMINVRFGYETGHSQQHASPSPIYGRKQPAARLITTLATKGIGKEHFEKVYLSLYGPDYIDRGRLIILHCRTN